MWWWCGVMILWWAMPTLESCLPFRFSLCAVQPSASNHKDLMFKLRGGWPSSLASGWAAGTDKVAPQRRSRGRGQATCVQSDGWLMELYSGGPLTDWLTDSSVCMALAVHITSPGFLWVVNEWQLISELWLGQVYLSTDSQSSPLSFQWAKLGTNTQMIYCRVNNYK